MCLVTTLVYVDCGVWIMFWSFGCQSEVQPFKMSYLASLDSVVTLQKKNSLTAYVCGRLFEQRVRELCDPLIQGAKQ